MSGTPFNHLAYQTTAASPTELTGTTDSIDTKTAKAMRAQPSGTLNEFHHDMLRKYDKKKQQQQLQPRQQQLDNPFSTQAPHAPRQTPPPYAPTSLTTTSLTSEGVLPSILNEDRLSRMDPVARQQCLDLMRQTDRVAGWTGGFVSRMQHSKQEQGERRIPPRPVSSNSPPEPEHNSPGPASYPMPSSWPKTPPGTRHQHGPPTAPEQPAFSPPLFGKRIFISEQPKTPPKQHPSLVSSPQTSDSWPLAMGSHSPFVGIQAPASSSRARMLYGQQQQQQQQPNLLAGTSPRGVSSPVGPSSRPPTFLPPFGSNVDNNDDTQSSSALDLELPPELEQLARQKILEQHQHSMAAVRLDMELKELWWQAAAELFVREALDDSELEEVRRCKAKVDK